MQRDLDQTSAHLLLAVCYLNMRPKRLSAARTSLNACIRSHPDLVGLYLLRASIFGEEGIRPTGRRRRTPSRPPETDYRHALDLNPNDDFRYVLLANRGLLRLRSGRLDEAVADLDAAIRLKPNQYQAHTTLAQVLQRKGRLDEAARGVHPRRSPAIRNRACWPGSIAAAPCSTPRGQTSRPAQHAAALRDLEEAIRQEPDKALKASDHVWRARLFFGGGISPRRRWPPATPP